MNWKINLLNFGMGQSYTIASSGPVPPKADDLIRLLDQLDDLKVVLAKAAQRMVDDPAITLEYCIKEQMSSEIKDFITQMFKDKNNTPP